MKLQHFGFSEEVVAFFKRYYVELSDCVVFINSEKVFPDGRVILSPDCNLVIASGDLGTATGYKNIYVFNSFVELISFCHFKPHAMNRSIFIVWGYLSKEIPSFCSKSKFVLAFEKSLTGRLSDIRFACILKNNEQPRIYLENGIVTVVAGKYKASMYAELASLSRFCKLSGMGRRNVRTLKPKGAGSYFELILKI